MKYTIKFFFSLLLFAQCERKAKEFLVFDLDQNHPTRTLVLSDLVTDLKAVPLETTSESFLPAYFNYQVGERYIITYSRNNVMQFTADGKFIRILATRGKGPGEFNNVASIIMDNSEEKLYLSHLGGNELLVFDLNSGSRQEGIPVPEKAARMIFLDDQEILAFGYGFSDYKRFRLNVKTAEIKDTVRIEEDKPSVSGSRITWVSVADGEIYSLFPESDTLYRYENQDFVPELHLKFTNQVDPNKTSTGRSLQFPFHSASHMLFGTHDVSIDKSAGYINMSAGENPKIFNYDKEDKKLFEITKFEDDLMKMTMEYIFPLRQHGNILSIKYSALEIIKHIEARPELKMYFSDLFNGYRLKEHDNPILVIGKAL